MTSRLRKQILWGLRYASIALLTYSTAAAYDWRFPQLDKPGDHKIVIGAGSQAIENTNFDWSYYVERNHLRGIKTEESAYKHYIRIGKMRGYQYCKKFKILVLVHLYQLDLMKEFVEQINFFMKNNPVNSYYIKINVPIDDRLLKDIGYYPDKSQEDVLEYVRVHAPYHPRLVTPENACQLLAIEQYLKRSLQIDPARIQVIFSENRGVDIGSFFLMLDQVKQENLTFDFLVKIHSKANPNWRRLLLAPLNLKMNKLLRLYDCIYTFKVTKQPDPLLIDIKNSLHVPDIPSCEYSFCGGTMFIAPYAFYEYMRSWDFVLLFNMLHWGHMTEDTYEHAFERLFGYIFTLLNFKTLCHDYYSANAHVAYKQAP